MLYFGNAKIKLMNKEDQILEQLNKIDARLGKTETKLEKLDKIEEKLGKMEKFMYEHLVTKQEHSELADKVMALTESVNKLITAVANFAKQVNDFDEHHKTQQHQITAMQDWIREASKKLGIEFKL